MFLLLIDSEDRISPNLEKSLYALLIWQILELRFGVLTAVKNPQVFLIT